MPITYSITSDSTSFTEDYDRLNISVNGTSTETSTTWSSLVIAVKGSALPRVWDNQYQNSFVEPLGGNAGSLESFKSHELPFTPTSSSGMNFVDRVLEVNSNSATHGPEFLYQLNSISKYDSSTQNNQNYIQITKVDADTGLVVSSFGTGGKLELRSSNNNFGSSQNSPEVVTDNTGNLYVLRDGEGSNSFQKYSPSGVLDSSFVNTAQSASSTNLLGVSGSNLYVISSNNQLLTVNTATGTSTQVSGAPAIPFVQAGTDSTSSGNPFVVMSETGKITWVDSSNTYSSYDPSTPAAPPVSKTFSLLNIPGASERFLSNKGELYVLDETLDKVSKFDSPSATAKSFELDLSSLASKFPLPSAGGSNWKFQGVGEDGSLYLKNDLTAGQNTPTSAFVKFELNPAKTALVLDTAWGVDGFVYSNSSNTPVGMVGDSLVIANQIGTHDYQLNSAQNSTVYPSFIGRSGEESFFRIDLSAAAGGSSQNSISRAFSIDSRPDYLSEITEKIDIRLVEQSEVSTKFGPNQLSASSYLVDTSKSTLSINLLDDSHASTDLIYLGWVDPASPFEYSSSDWSNTGYSRHSHVYLWDAQINHTGPISQLQVSLDQAEIAKIISSAANSANPVLTLGKRNHDMNGEYSTMMYGSRVQIDFDTLISDANANKSFFLNTWNDQGNQVDFVVDLKSRTTGTGAAEKKFVDVLFRTADGSLMSNEEASQVLSREFSIGFDLSTSGISAGAGAAVPADTGTAGTGTAVSPTALPSFAEMINLDIQIKDAAGLFVSNGTDLTVQLRHVPLSPFEASFNGNLIQIHFDSNYPVIDGIARLPHALPWDGDEWEAWVGNPSASNFTVTVNGSPVTVTGAAMDGGLVLLTESSIPTNATVNVSYTDPNPTTNDIKNVLQDQYGTDVPSFNVAASYRNDFAELNVLSGAQFGWNSSLEHSERDYFEDFNVDLTAAGQALAVANDSTKLKLIFTGSAITNPHFDGSAASSNLIADYEYVKPQLSFVVNKSDYQALKTKLGVAANTNLSIADVIEPSNDLATTIIQWDAVMSNTLNGSGPTFELANYSFPTSVGAYNIVGTLPISNSMIFNGSAYADVVIASFGSQTINGFAGDDQFFGGPGNDVLNGGTGIDTIHYDGNKSEYTVVNLSGGRYTVSQNTPNARGALEQSGIDSLSGIEKIQFNDQVMQLEVPLDPMLDDIFVINASTPTLASNPTFVARPETGVGGFDTLDLSWITSAAPIYVSATDGQIIVQGVTPAESKVYRFEDFDEFVIKNAGGVNFHGTQVASEVVQLKVASSNDIRLANKPTDDLSSETDIVDYSATSDAVTVNLGSTTNGGDGWFYATATKGTTGGVDKIAGAEGIFGSTASDSITGGLRDNLLAGGAGNDTLDGAAGNDVLVGGAGSGDILIGGTGKDILIDIDGATLTGSASKKNQGALGDKDVFVVRNGSTIENFHVAKDGAGLAGRAAASANDTILFNLSVGILSEKLAGYSAAVAGKSAAQLQVELAKIKGDIDIRVERTAAGSDDWAVIASYTGGLHSSTVELARVIVKDMDASAMPASSVLTDVALPEFSLDNAMSDKIDELVFSQVSDLLVDDQAINLAVALESVRQGTVRESKNGIMFGDFTLPERIFNPGAGSEKIFGSNGKDIYEFLVQDLKSNGNSTPDAGMDTIMDTGGDDAVAFSNISLSQLNQLDFTAVQLGRESGNYSLKSNYSQTDGTITNTGGFTWTGHFREGFGMELEKITLGNTTLEMADVRYRYDAEGNLLNWTPNQVASSGKDTIMVGGVGRSADASTFVVEKGTDAAFNTGIGGDDKQNLFLWDADASDVINLKAFFDDETTARNAVQDAVSPETAKTLKNTFTIDLNATQDLVLNFMDTTLTQESLEMMIARAYATS